MSAYQCTDTPTPTRMFTAGKMYAVIGQEGRLDVITDDLGHQRCLLPYKDGSAGFIVQNDTSPAGYASIPRHAYFQKHTHP